MHQQKLWQLYQQGVRLSPTPNQPPPRTRMPVFYWSKRRKHYVHIPYDQMVTFVDGNRGVLQLGVACKPEETSNTLQAHREIFTYCNGRWIFKGDLTRRARLVWAIINAPKWVKLLLPCLLGGTAGWCVSQLAYWWLK
jgi:hypothetical protein